MRQRVDVSRVLVSIAGVITVAAYAGLMALQALVLDPLAAVPGATLEQIHAQLEQRGFDVAGDIRSVLGSAIVGIALALAVAVWSVLGRLAPMIASMLFLGVVALGAPVTFGTGFALGMDVADAYGVGGGSHTIWAGVLYVTSLAAVGAILLTLATVWAQGNRRRAVLV